MRSHYAVKLEPRQGICMIGEHEDRVYFSVLHKGQTQLEWGFIHICGKHLEKAQQNQYPIVPLIRINDWVEQKAEDGNLYALMFTN